MSAVNNVTIISKIIDISSMKKKKGQKTIFEERLSDLINQPKPNFTNKNYSS